MLEIIQHRVNRLSDLRSLAPFLGAEIDLRTLGSNIVLSHDVGVGGIRWLDFIDEWCAKQSERGILVLNVKEDGLETEVETLLQKRCVQRYFFLDCAPPTLIRRTQTRLDAPYSVRFSEYETLDAAMALKGHAKWVWVDCFSGVVPSVPAVNTLKGFFEVCLVSPELQGYPLEKISQFAELRTAISAVCTKHPEIWKQYAKAQACDRSSLLQRSA